VLAEVILWTECGGLGKSSSPQAGNNKLRETALLHSRLTGGKVGRERSTTSDPGWIFHPGAFSPHIIYYHQEKFSVVTGLTMVTTSM